MGQNCIYSRVCVCCVLNCCFILKVGQNHICTVYVWYVWQGNHKIYGHIRCIYTALANPFHTLLLRRCPEYTVVWDVCIWYWLTLHSSVLYDPDSLGMVLFWWKPTVWDCLCCYAPLFCGTHVGSTRSMS